MISRKEFLRTSFKAVFGQVAEIIDTHIPAEMKEVQSNLFPPGAVPNFSEACTSCGACVSACPADAIQVQVNQTNGKELPVIVPSRRACVMCDDRSCIKVCEDEALLFPDNKGFPHIGLAVIREDICLAYTGSQCMTCFDACPLKRQAIQLKLGKPVIIEESCTGCGICEQECVLTTMKGVEIVPV